MGFGRRPQTLKDFRKYGSKGCNLIKPGDMTTFLMESNGCKAEHAPMQTQSAPPKPMPTISATFKAPLVKPSPVESEDASTESTVQPTPGMAG